MPYVDSEGSTLKQKVKRCLVAKNRNTEDQEISCQ